MRAMKMRLRQEPESQMEDFWEMCNLQSYDNLNIEQLCNGLEWLSSWDMREALAEFESPVLSLFGQNDPLLPMAEMEKQWAGLDFKICENAGHTLPVSKPQWCADHIKAFADVL